MGGASSLAWVTSVRRLHEVVASLAAGGESFPALPASFQSVTISRGGHRWYASILCKVTTSLPTTPTRRQAAAGTVGVDLAPLNSHNPESAFVENPRHLRTAMKRLQKAQQALARTQKGSARRHKAVQRVGRLHHVVAERGRARHITASGRRQQR
ncbi:transposase [Streptomyces goshikiensis]|uniref:transposase n=1 Tax=Streptomyces goshikiensis TaxID=1942 RepID=UPI00367DA4E7